MKVLLRTILFQVLFLSFGVSVFAQSDSLNKAKTEKLNASYRNFGDALTGILVLDALTKDTVFQTNANKAFVPASNVKILTLYTCLKTLGDSLVGFKYRSNADTLWLWGMGDPTFLHSLFAENGSFNFLKKYKHIQVSFDNNHLKAIGKGWSWDDYNDAYFVENNSMPMYGNVVNIENTKRGIAIMPAIFSENFVNENSDIKIQRAQCQNVFHYNFNAIYKDGFHQNVPFKVDNNLVLKMLADTLKTKVTAFSAALPTDAKTFFSIKADTVYKQMMKNSDNFLAEQLLAMAANPAEINIEKTISNAKEMYFKNLNFNWVDGSGMSRYNLASPFVFVSVLSKMYQEFSRESLFPLFAIGGKPGTLKNSYLNENPYVFAKTGSMTGVYGQSGYVITNSGKTLIFSVLSNNFLESASKMRKKTEDFIQTLREHF